MAEPDDRPAGGFVPCPHCDALGLGAKALEKHIARRHSGEPGRRVVLTPGDPRPHVEDTP